MIGLSQFGTHNMCIENNHTCVQHVWLNTINNNVDCTYGIHSWLLQFNWKVFFFNQDNLGIFTKNIIDKHTINNNAHKWHIWAEILYIWAETWHIYEKNETFDKKNKTFEQKKKTFEHKNDTFEQKDDTFEQKNDIFEQNNDTLQLKMAHFIWYSIGDVAVRSDQQ